MSHEPIRLVEQSHARSDGYVPPLDRVHQIVLLCMHSPDETTECQLEG